MQTMIIGIGCHLDRWESGEISVSGLKPGGSAEEVGLMVGSVLHSVDGIAGWNLKKIGFFYPGFPMPARHSRANENGCSFFNLFFLP
jgi:hypothetical protein